MYIGIEIVSRMSESTAGLNLQLKSKIFDSKDGSKKEWMQLKVIALFITAIVFI